MFTECRHILTTGRKCKAAALRGHAYCKYHTPARRQARIALSKPLKFASLGDPAGVQRALRQVLSGLASRRIDPRRGGLYLNALQIATKLVSQIERKPAKPSTKSASSDTRPL